MRIDKKSPQRSDKKAASRSHKQGVVGYSKKSALLEDAITQMNAGKYGRSSAALKELLALDPLNMEARRLFATLHLRLGSLIPARQAFESLVNEAFERQDYWLAESLLREYLAAGPRCVPFLEKLGTIYQDKGDALAAVTEYGKAIDILLEDPDPDHPQLASQLYAKVRELAPASPVAFRLAAFFDAQSGELIVRAKPAQPESADGATAGTASAHVAQESNPAVPFTDETHLVSGFAATSHQSVESPTAVDDSSASPAVGEAVDEVPVAPEQSLVQSGEQNLTVADVSVDVPAERSFDSHAGATLAETGEAQSAQDHPPADSSTAAARPDTAAESSAISFVELPSTETSEVGDRELRLADAAPRGFDARRSEEETTQANADPLSAPMPWERVEDSAITIPEREIETPPESAAATQPALESVPPITAPSEDSGNLTDRFPAESSPETFGEPSSSASEPPPSSIGLESQKKEDFSWESVFARAWNFGGAPSSLDQKEYTPNVEIAPAEHAATTAKSPVYDQAPGHPDLASHVGAGPGSPPSSELVAAPMPWDQVQDATVKIVPPEEVQPPTLPIAAEEACVTPTALDFGVPDSPATPTDEGQPEIASTSAPVSMASGTLSSSEAAPSALSGETTVQLVEEMPVTVPYEPAATPVDVEPVADASVSENAPSPAFAEALMDTVTETPVQDSDSGSPASVQSSEQPIDLPEPPAEHLSPSPAVEASLEAPHLRNENASTSAIGEPAPDALSYEPSPMLEQPLHWKTGEVSVQTHRPAPKRRKRSSTPEPDPASVAPSVEDQAQVQSTPIPQQEPAAVESPVQNTAPAQESESWASASGSIRFVDSSVSTIEHLAAPTPAREHSSPAQPATAAVSAVDVLFDSTQRTARIQTHERVSPNPRFRLGAALNRIRIGVFVFLRSCFSTTRAIVTTVAAFAVFSAALLVLLIGVVGMAWLAMEEKPAPAYQSLTTVPQRLLADSKSNGYLFLLGFEAPPTADPVQAGYERKPDAKDTELTNGCTNARRSEDDRILADATKGWYGAADPAAQFRRNQDLVKALASQSESTLGRYKQWLKMRFEDWGYGQSVSPPCAAILSAHRLFVADGFTQTPPDAGIDRLETDMEAWRTTLSQAKTLPVKTMALQAINDDVAVASGLLVRPESDGITPDRLAKMLRPLDQMELSLRWPMQSQFVVATKTLEARLRADRMGPMPLHVRIASTLPLPKQRRFNDYAKYYEASYKAAGEGRFGSLPKRANYVWSPAGSLMDVLRNPLENLIGIEPLAEWGFYSGLVVDTDARLRLASLQVWLRRAPQGANLMAQIAKAGQGLYDPYTGFPMLVNLAKGVMYSVGHDGKDQDGHPQADVVAAIPPGIALTARITPGSPGLR